MRPADGNETVITDSAAVESRRIIEILRMRAHLLAGDDRTLLEMYLEHGNSFGQIGHLMGLTGQNVGRRIRRITRRLTDDTYTICLRNRDDFNGRELAWIKDRLVHGLSERCISRKHGVTLYRVRTTLSRARKYAASMKGGNL